MSFFTNPFANDSSPLDFLAPNSASPSSSISSKRRASLASISTTTRRSSLGLALENIGPLESCSPIASTSTSSSSNNNSSNFNGGLANEIMIGLGVSSSERSSGLHQSLVSSPPRQSRKNSHCSIPSSRSDSRDSRSNDSPTPTPGPPRRVSLHSTPAPPLYSPTSSFVAATPFFVQSPPLSRSLVSNQIKDDPFLTTVDFSRRRSVDVGVLGHGSHQQVGNGGRSKRMREAVGPDAGDKETGFTGSTLKGGKDRLLGKHLASILAHSLALCSPPLSPPLLSNLHLSSLSTTLAAIPASPDTSPANSRRPSHSPSRSSMGGSRNNSATYLEDPHADAAAMEMPLSPLVPAIFPLASENKRAKLIGTLQSWTFNAMSFNSDELLSCVGLMFESVRNMEGVEFDLDKLKSLLLSLRSAYHTRNGYHNFSHAIDVTQACYSFLVRMGLAPPLYLLCEDDYDSNAGEGRRKWRRNRAVQEGGMGELLRPMDVFALLVAAIGHDVGHPGLSNAYMVNARTPVAQVYKDKSVLENFHTVTLMHMLRRHNFDYLLGGDFGHLGDKATSFRKILEGSILATDMSQHFGFVNQLTELGKKYGGKLAASKNIEEDRLLLCAGLIKCADISNPTRPHRISSVWSTALLNEWNIQAAIETEFGLPISVMMLDPLDSKAQARSQVGFIDLFAKPLFTAMASVVDEFSDFAEKLRDGRAAWDAIAQRSDEAFSKPISTGWKLAAAPSGRSPSRDSISSATTSPPSPIATSPTTLPRSIPVPPANTMRGRVHRGGCFSRHVSQGSDGSINSSTAASPLSPYFTTGSLSSTGTSGFSTLGNDFGISSTPSCSSSSPNHRHQHIFGSSSNTSSSNGYGYGNNSGSASGQGGQGDPFHLFGCGGTCKTATATCETCLRRDPGARRGSLGAWVGIRRGGLGEEDDAKERMRDREGEGVGEWVLDIAWPPYPFQPC